MYVYFSIFLTAILLCCTLNHWRRLKIVKKVCSMSSHEKCQLLNEIISPFGYWYLPCQDLFVSTFDAWQRDFGYTYSYDRFAPYFNMVIDSEPVYFHYHNRTWLVEFWKGQYGINTGAEIGIYCTDTIVPPSQRKRELFHTVADGDIPTFSIKLHRYMSGNEKEIAILSIPHWWLAVFRMGCFSHPSDLFAELCIKFPDCDMADAFAEALISLGYHEGSFKICDNCICLHYESPITPAPCGSFTRLVRQFALWENRFFCRLYQFITRPFCSTSDRLVYLYFYLPFVFRRCLRLRRAKKYLRYRKCCRRKGGKE